LAQRGLFSLTGGKKKLFLSKIIFPRSRYLKKIFSEGGAVPTLLPLGAVPLFFGKLMTRESGARRKRERGPPFWEGSCQLVALLGGEGCSQVLSEIGAASSEGRKGGSFSLAEDVFRRHRRPIKEKKLKRPNGVETARRGKKEFSSRRPVITSRTPGKGIPERFCWKVELSKKKKRKGVNSRVKKRGRSVENSAPLQKEG